MAEEEDIYNQVMSEQDIIDQFGEGAFFVGGNSESEEETPKPIEEDNVLEIDDSYKQDFTNLLNLGRLSGTFRWSGHTFRIHTLNTDEILSLGILHKPYSGTISDVRAYTTIVVAASLESVDGRPPILPLGPSDDTLESRFNYVKDNYYQWTIDAIYTKYLELEKRVGEILEEMGKV